ncbi:Hypothetical predicted protein, partial [Marmota monax]
HRPSPPAPPPRARTRETAKHAPLRGPRGGRTVAAPRLARHPPRPPQDPEQPKLEKREARRTAPRRQPESPWSPRGTRGDSLSRTVSPGLSHVDTCGPGDCDARRARRSAALLLPPPPRLPLTCASPRLAAQFSPLGKFSDPGLSNLEGNGRVGRLQGELRGCDSAARKRGRGRRGGRRGGVIPPDPSLLTVAALGTGARLLSAPAFATLSFPRDCFHHLGRLRVWPRVRLPLVLRHCLARARV